MQSPLSRFEDNALGGLEGLSIPLPTFPINTDGIDFHGKNGVFKRVKISNFDDTIVAKPGYRGDYQSNCTEDLWIEDCDITWGVGMTIGSIAPNYNHACINNVTFKNIRFEDPLKAIYIKPNPGNAGSGQITNILYEDIVINRPIWWAIYIGPQQ